MARLSKRYAPKGAFAPERFPPPPPEPEPLPEPQPEPTPAYSYTPLPALAVDMASAGDALAGVNAAALRAAIAENLWPHGGDPGGTNTKRLVVPVRGAGSRVWDTEGREYLDALAGEVGVNLGHGRQEVRAAMAAQAAHLAVAPGDAPNVPAALLAGRLAALAPTGAGSRVLFTSGGPEAVEVALQVAKAYGRAKGFPGRYKLIGQYYADHGSTAGALSVSGLAHRKTAFEPLVPGAIHVTPPYHSRCPYCADTEGCTCACAEEVRRVAAFAGPESVAAVIVEPVQSGGCIVPPPGYFERVRATCDETGMLLVADETTCGMGRIGTLFASEAFEVRPDIVTVAHGLTGGYAALGAVIVSKEVADALLASEREPFVHDGAFASLPVAAAALATLDLLERDELPGRSRDMGAYLLRELETALRGHPNVGEIRGIGLWVAVELVRDRESRAPLDDPAALRSLADETTRRGLLCRVDARPFPVIRLAPPFTIEREDVDRIVAIIAATLDALRETAGGDISAGAIPGSDGLQAAGFLETAG